MKIYLRKINVLGEGIFFIGMDFAFNRFQDLKAKIKLRTCEVHLNVPLTFQGQV